MPPKMLPKKKKGKAFGSFGQSLPSVDDSGEKGLSFGKALNTIRNIESSYAAENTSDSKTLTRKVSTITKEKSLKTLDKAVFSWTELSSNYLGFVENVYAKLKDVKESEPVNIDWTGLEHMTDAIFGCLLEKTRLPGYSHVLGIILNGCCKLTDIGIRWLSQCFPKLKEVALAGCLGVTETGVHYLLTNCSDLKSLDLTATNVMMLPSQIVGKDVDMAGCPLISPIESYLEQKGLDGLKDPNYKKHAGKNMLKVCLIRPHGFTTNVLPQITGEKVEKRVEVLFKPQVYLKNTDIMANIIEFEEGMIDKFVTKRSVILVPYEHDESKPVDNLVPWLLSVYCQVLTKVSRASVLFVALVKDNNVKVNHHQAAFDVRIKAAKEKLLKQKKQLMEKKATKETPLTKLDQDNFSHTKELLDMLEVSSFTFTTAIKDSMKVYTNLITEVLSACEKTIKLYPEYEELSSYIFQYACSDECMKVFDSKDLTGALSLEGGALTSVKTMQLLHLFGRLLYLDIIDGPTMVMEIKWLSNLLSGLKPIENDGKFPCVSETTKVMSISESEQIVTQQKLGSKNSMALLPQLGLGMSTRNAYVAYDGLESDPPVNMNEFIGQEADVQQICYKFNLAHSLATNVMNQIFTFSSYVRKPTMMWKNGIVLVENVTQTIVQLKNDKDSWFLELLVQTSKTNTGKLKETLPKALTHSTEKLKIIIEYVLSSLRIPYQEKSNYKHEGTFIRGLETTATYDPQTKEFILDSPTMTSIKYLPGNLAKTVNHCLVMAQLYTLGKCHGTHLFLVQVRSMEDHSIMPGIEIGDIGPKFGFVGVDNGYMKLNKYRIPRMNMLMKYAQVLENGDYIKPQNSKLIYGAMVMIRVGIVIDCFKCLSMAIVIAIRYSAVRRQTELTPGGKEPQVLDYQTQQYKLLPLLATTYAFKFAAMGMSSIYSKISGEIDRGNLEALPQLHALASGLKAFCSWVGCAGIEVCRMSCGGHGYSQASGLPLLYANIVGSCTYEGENTVMMLQVARYLSKCYIRVQKGERLPDLVQYLNVNLNTKSSLNESCSFDSLIAAYEHRAARMVAFASKMLQLNKQQGMPGHEAWNKATVPFTTAAKAHCHLFVMKNFANLISDNKMDPSTQNALSQLCKLYAVHGIVENMGEFMQDGYFNPGQISILNRKVLTLLEDIRPNAVALVDAFDYPDQLLQSCLGRYDGQVYEALYNYAKSSPLNDSDIHSSYYNYIKPMMDRRSKGLEATAKL